MVPSSNLFLDVAGSRGPEPFSKLGVPGTLKQRGVEGAFTGVTDIRRSLQHACRVMHGFGGAFTLKEGVPVYIYIYTYIYICLCIQQKD